MNWSPNKDGTGFFYMLRPLENKILYFLIVNKTVYKLNICILTCSNAASLCLLRLAPADLYDNPVVLQEDP